MKICGEKLSSRPDLIPQFRSDLNNIITSLDLVDSQIYNADESALFWKLLPDKTLVHAKEKSAPGRKMCKERVTFLCCANKSGLHRLDIVVIGKSRNPRSFKRQPPVEYYSSKNAWMTSNIFLEWFQTSFVRQVKLYQAANNLPEKAILIIDNARCHTSAELLSECGNYRTIFLPPNCTSLIQPMDQNAIRLTKMHYKKGLLCDVVNYKEEDYSQFLKGFTINDCCILLKLSWHKVRRTALSSCWSKLFPEEWNSEENLPLAVLREGHINGIHFITQTFNTSLQINITEAEVEDWINEIEELDAVDLSSTDSEEGVDSNNTPTVSRVNSRDAIQSFNTCIKWAEENDVSTENILVLKDLKISATEKSLTNVRQSTVTDFFKKAC